MEARDEELVEALTLLAVDRDNLVARRESIGRDLGDSRSEPGPGDSHHRLILGITGSPALNEDHGHSVFNTEAHPFIRVIAGRGTIVRSGQFPASEQPAQLFVHVERTIVR
jgi:hypothetical protein